VAGAAGVKAVAIQADVSKRDEVVKLFAEVEREFGRLDILVNNAGDFFAAKFQDLTDEQWDRIMNANLKSQFLCAQAAAPIMKRQGRGRIVNISSLGGLLAWWVLVGTLTTMWYAGTASATFEVRFQT